MIVNVNPYETSFDENSHVMKFSAVAKGVMTTKNTTPIPSPALEVETPELKAPRVVRLSMVEGGEEEDVIYQGTFILSTHSTRDALTRRLAEEEEDEGDEEEDQFVNALLEELSALRTAVSPRRRRINTAG